MFGQNTSFGGNSSFGAANNAPKPAFGGFGTTTSQPTTGGFGGGGLFGQNTTNTSTGGGKKTYLMIFVNKIFSSRTFWTADPNLHLWTNKFCIRSTSSHEHVWTG